MLRDAFGLVFTIGKFFVGHDLHASARALLGFQPGFAAILGTGTNTCLYDGQSIIHHVDSGAHILGDEGSGFSIGKRLLIDYMRGKMPAEIAEMFKQTYKLTNDQIHDSVYSKPLANRYFAAFSKFITQENLKHKYLYNIVQQSFNSFFEEIVSQYPGYQNYKFNCIGSVGFNFRDILEKVAVQWVLQLGKILKSPLVDLVSYHSKSFDQGQTSELDVLAS